MTRNYNFHYPISAASHYNRAVICFDNVFSFADGSHLFYSALELRNCIERFLFEYLVLIQIGEENLEKFRNSYRVKSFSMAIYESEPEFDKKLEFTNFYLQTIGAHFTIPKLDEKALNSYYGKLGNYLHNFKRPDETVQNQEWWNNFILFIQETKSYLSEYLNVPRAFFKMNDKGLLLYQEYKNENISRDEIRAKILQG